MASRESAPDIAASARAASLTSRTSGPAWSNEEANATSPERETRPNVGLTRREREVLGWLKEGKSSWDISMLLGISERTANFHAANIMRKLGTYNRAQAVAGHLRSEARIGSDRLEIKTAEPLPEGGYRLAVRMTLTAPGCGMGTLIADEARERLLELPGVKEASVELVWDPPWSREMMSDAARLEMGMF